MGGGEKRRAGFGYQTVCLGFTLPTSGDGALKSSYKSVLRARGTGVEKREEETRPVEGEPRQPTLQAQRRKGDLCRVGGSAVKE